MPATMAIFTQYLIMIRKITQPSGFIAVLLAITGFRLLTLAALPARLDTDEAQYWLWSQHLSLGYHSKPPLIAYIIHLFTSLFGHSMVAIKGVVPLSYMAIAVIMAKFMRKLTDKETANLAALSLFLSIGVSYSCTKISTDPLMLLFWALGFYALVVMVKDNKPHYSWLLAISLGLAVLAKYTALVFLLSLFLYLALSPRARKALPITQGLKTGLLLIALLMPNVYWNLTTENSAFSHVLHHNIGVQGFAGLHVLKALEFIAAQLALISPALFPVILIALFMPSSWKNEPHKLLVSFALPMFLIIVLQSLLKKSYANWAVAMYITGVPLGVLLLSKFRLRKWLLASHFSSGLFALFALPLFDLAIMQGIVPYKMVPHMARESLIWPSIAPDIKALNQYNFLFINRHLWAESAYYGQVPISKIYKWPGLDLDTYTNIKTQVGKDFIFLAFSKAVPKSIKSHFGQTRLLKTLSPAYANYDLPKLYIFKLSDFLGFA